MDVSEMNKLKWSVLFIWASFIITLRVAKLILVSYFPFKKDIYILYWFGLLANNIIQLAHAVYLSKKFGFIIHVPPHEFLTVEEKYALHAIKPKEFQQNPYFPSTSAATFLDLQTKPNKSIGSILPLVRQLFWRFDVLPFSPDIKAYRKVLREDILPIIPHHDDTLIKDDTLVIHIRTGEIFQMDINRTMIQPPVSFYSELIDKCNFKDIVIVTQDDFRNPCINQLEKLFPDIKIQTSTLVNDISTILSARNLVIANSTFSLCLALASDKINRLFIPQFDITAYFNYTRAPFWPNIIKYAYVAGSSESQFQNLDLEVHLIKILNYIPMGGWLNEQHQYNTMIEHPREDIVFK
jgi:hypothetical protein